MHSKFKQKGFIMYFPLLVRTSPLSYVLTFLLFLSIDTFAATATSTNCRNPNGGNETCIPDDCGNLVCTTSGGSSSSSGSSGNSGGSKIDNWTLNFHHFSREYSVANKPEACTSCGGSSTSPETPSLYLKRYFRSRNTNEPICSLGPANFTNYDLSLVAFPDEGKTLVQIFDPALNSKNLFYANEDGNFYDEIEQQRKKLVLYNSAGEITTSLDNLAYGILHTRAGTQFHFEFFLDDNNSYCGRFVSYKDRRADGYTISYVHSATSDVDPSLKKLFSKVVDSNNRELTFNYLEEKKNGIYPISSVTLPNGSQITYDYTEGVNGYLSAVNYPDGTSSSYAFEVDEDGYLQENIFDAGEKGYHRSKVAYYSAVSGSLVDRKTLLVK